MAHDRRPDPPGIPSRNRIPMERGGTVSAPTSLIPSPELVRTGLEAAKRWSPAGIAIAMIAVFFAVGGHDLVDKLVIASDATRALRKEVSALRVDLAIERGERAKIMAEQHATKQNLSALCDFVSNINGGRPNKTWCSADGRAISVTEKHTPPPFRTTETVWIYP